jgi:hypothetical protein
MKKILHSIGAIVALSVAAATTHAAFISARLDDVASGPMGGYGLRLDNRHGMQTFSFEPGVVMDFHYTRPNRGAAIIHGVVKHNESGQIYDLHVYFKWRAFTNADGSDWRSNTSGDLYKTMLLDLLANGNEQSSSSLAEIHDASYAADRLAFKFSRVTLTLQEGQGNAAFVPHYNLSRIPNLYRFYHYPQGENVLPFVIAKGLTLEPDSEQLIGHVELDPRGPKAQLPQKHIYHQELFFALAPLPLPPDVNPPPNDNNPPHDDPLDDTPPTDDFSDNDPPDDWERDPNNNAPIAPDDNPVSPPANDLPNRNGAVPEPSTMALLLIGSGGVLLLRHRNKD